MRIPILAMAVIILVNSCVGQSDAPKKASAKGPSQVAMTSEEMRTIAIDFVNALSHFYMATHLDDQAENEVQMMATMMNDNRWLRDGIAFLAKYKTHRNEMVRSAAKGTILGAGLLRKSNSDLLAIMKGGSGKSPEELKYEAALYGSRQKEGFRLIYISAPWITGVMFKPRTSNDPLGRIPYTISKPDRAAIIEHIDDLFGKELANEARGERHDRHNAIVIAARAIRKNLVGDTYEEAEEK